MRALVASVAISVLVLASCGDDDEPVATRDGSSTTSTTAVVADDGAQARLDEARRRWDEADVDGYRLTWTVQCFCPRTTFVDTVVDGEVVEHREAPGSEAFDDPGPKTMETIFDEVQAAIDLEPHSLDVVYDEATGAVRSYFVDEAANIADEEHGLEVDLQRLDGDAAEPTEVVLAELTEAHGCGHGFQAGRPDQRVGIFFRHPAGPATSGAVTLPTAEWTVTLRVGEDLFANWCDDVLEAGEPEPVVTEEWDVVAGVLDVTVPDGGQQGRATLRATGLVAERPDGERVPLGDIVVENPWYATFAG